MTWADQIEFEMATLQEVRDTVDAWLAARWPTLQARQDVYASNHGGRYFQGLRTHSNFPVDAIEVTADLLATHPTDQSETWLDAVPSIPTAWPCAFKMDVYNGPSGWGYVGSVYVYVSQLDRIYTRSQNVGSETFRTVGWRELPVVPLI